MLRREFAAVAALTLVSSAATAQDTVKIGLILPMTGQQASTGKQIDAAVKLYMAQNGSTVAGKKIEVILKDDTSVPDVTKRLAQELVVNDKVAILAGFGLTPSALATAPTATQAKVPEVVMAAGTSTITEASPFVVRTSFTLAQSSVPMAEWAFKNGIKKVVTMVSDFGPGIDAEKSFSEKFKADGGMIVESLRTPLRGPDFSPVLQKVHHRWHTPIGSCLAIGLLAFIPMLQFAGAGIVAIAATGMIYLSYLLGNFALLRARLRGWPRKPAPFSLGRWGLPLTLLGIAWGGGMLVNFAWPRAASNPTPEQTGLALNFHWHWLNNRPVLWTVLVVVLIVGTAYWALVQRTKPAHTQAPEEFPAVPTPV